MAPDSFDLVIFDCDGVLVDSEVIGLQTLSDTLIGHGVDADLDYVTTTFLGRSFSVVIADFHRLTGRAAPEALEADFLASLFEAYRADLRPMQGAYDLVAGMTTKSCVATSSSMERATLSLQLTGLYPLLRDRIFSASMVARGKPAPDLFLHAAASCDASPSRCLVIEDSDVGLLAARSAGMTAWRFTGGSHLKRDGQALPAANDGVRSFRSLLDVAMALRTR